MKWINEIRKRFHRTWIGPDHWTNVFKRYTAKTFGNNFCTDTDTNTPISALDFLSKFNERMSLKQSDPFKWFIAYGFASMVQDVVMFTNNVWHSLSIFHSNYFVSKIHCLPCGDDVPIGEYRDIDTRMESALYRLVVNYVEYELDGIISYNNESKDLTNVYHWIKIARPAMLDALNSLLASNWEEYLELETRLQNLDDHYLRVIVDMRRSMWT